MGTSEESQPCYLRKEKFTERQEERIGLSKKKEFRRGFHIFRSMLFIYANIYNLLPRRISVYNNKRINIAMQNIL